MFFLPPATLIRLLMALFLIIMASTPFLHLRPGLCQILDITAETVEIKETRKVEILGCPGSARPRKIDLPVTLPPGAVLRLISLDCGKASKGWKRLLSDLRWDSSPANESVNSTRLFLKISARLEKIFGPGSRGAAEVLESFDGPAGIWVYDVSDTVFLIWGKLSSGAGLAVRLASQGKWLPRDIPGATLQIKRNDEGESILGYAERDGFAGVSNSTGLIESFLSGPSAVVGPDPGDDPGAFTAIDLAPAILEGSHFRTYFIDPAWTRILGNQPVADEISTVCSDIRPTPKGIVERTTVVFKKNPGIRPLGQGWASIAAALPADIAWHAFNPLDEASMKAAGNAFGLGQENLDPSDRMDNLSGILAPMIEKCPWVILIFRPSFESIAPALDPGLIIPGEFDPRQVARDAAGLLVSRYLALPGPPDELVAEGPAGAFTAGLPLSGRAFHARQAIIRGQTVLVLSTSPDTAAHLVEKSLGSEKVEALFGLLASEAETQPPSPGPTPEITVIRASGTGPAAFAGISRVTGTLVSGTSAVSRNAALAAGTAAHLASVLSGTGGTIACRYLSPDGLRLTEVTLFREFGAR